MVSRATHYNNKRRHAQREFGQTKPRLLPRDVGTSWQGAFVATLSDGPSDFNLEHPITHSLGDTPEARALRLRELCKVGVLRMRAVRDGDKFIEYRWSVE